jgi:flagellar biosynthesis protein FliR
VSGLSFVFAFDLSRVLTLGLLGGARILPVFLIAPFFGGRLVPATVRIGVAVTFVALLWPALHLQTPDLSTVGPATLVALFLKELVIGVALGFLVSLPFWAVEGAGRLADTARGANLAEVLVPQTGAQTSPLADVGLQIAVLLFFATGGHLLFLRALAESYQAVPLFGFPEGAALRGVGDLAVVSTGRLMLATLGLAAPVLAALFLADLALGLVNRVAPQIQVYFLGMPAKAVVGVFVFLLALTAMLGALRGHFAEALRSIGRALDLLR